jgi:sugar phosphate isomerase/epimerase
MNSIPTRREFLERTTTGAAALALMKSGLARAQAASGMFVSLPPWAVARGVGWPEQAQLAARVGYGGIDWAFGPAREAGVEATRAMLEELDIVPAIVNLPMSGQNAPLNGDDDSFRARLPQLEEDTAFAAAIGGRNMMMVLSPTSSQPREERWNFVVDRLGAVGEVLQKSGIRLGLEFLGPLYFRTRSGGRGRGRGGDPSAPPPPRVPFVWTLNDTVRLGTECGPNIGAVLDAWHWYHSGGTTADILATDPSRIVHVHVSDANEMPAEEVRDNMRLLAGEGVIDLVGFFQALQQIGWTGGVAPETIGPRIPDDMPPEESARLALEATRAVMQRAGVL